MEFSVLHTTGKSTSLNASDEVFAAEVKKPLLAQAVRVYLSNQRQGTSKVKTRGEVDRTKKKWFKQKGTGNARHGARSANIFVGGGVSHGPNGEQNWSLTLPKQLKKKALISALSQRASDIVVTTVLDDIQPKTKDAVAFLEKLVPGARRILIVTHVKMENITRSMKNLSRVILVNPDQLGVYHTMIADRIIMTKESIRALEERLTPKPKVVVTEAQTEEKAVVKKVKKTTVKSETKTKTKTKTKTAQPAKKKVVAKTKKKA